MSTGKFKPGTCGLCKTRALVKRNKGMIDVPLCSECADREARIHRATVIAGWKERGLK